MNKQKSTRDRITNILSNRKTAITSEALCTRVNSSPKTVRNVLGRLINEGVVAHNEFYLTNSKGRAVLGYISA